MKQPASHLALAGLLLAALGGLLAPPPAAAMFKPPTDVPVDRLVRNVGRYVESHPEDAQGWYVLGRIHSLALVTRSRAVGVYGEADADSLPFVDHQFHDKRDEAAPTPAELRTHLAKAVGAFERALELAPESARTWLGLAYTLDAASTVAAAAALVPPGAAAGEPGEVERARHEALVAELGADGAAAREAAEQSLAAAGARALPVLRAHWDDPHPERRLRVRALVARLWKEAAIVRYRRAFDLAIDADRALPRLPIRGLFDLVAHEAGSSWLRLVEERGAREEEKDAVEAIGREVLALKKKPRGAITPIVFPLDAPRPLASLLAPEHLVPFDLDGDLCVERWPWVRSDTAILVWDPRGKGRIGSGRQLFGSVTWWMLWRDGYQALDALDDDGDGQVAGRELAGLAVWRDANGDGISQPGEVVRAARLGIVALATRPLHRGPDGPSHPAGVRFADGRVLPTYDWTVDAAEAR